MALTCTPLSTTGITTVDNVGDIDTYGGAAALTFKVNDTLTITPRIMQQRADYNGFPMADYSRMPGNGIGYPVPSPGAGPAAEADVSEQLHPSTWFNVPEGGYDPGPCIRSRSLENRLWRARLLDRLFHTQGGSRPRMRATSSTRRITSGVPGGTPQPGGIEEIRITSDSSRKCASPPICKGRCNSWPADSTRIFTAACRLPPIIRRDGARVRCDADGGPGESPRAIRT